MPSATASSRCVRLGLRATPEQETLVRRAAEVAQKSLTPQRSARRDRASGG